MPHVPVDSPAYSDPANAWARFRESQERVIERDTIGTAYPRPYEDRLIELPSGSALPSRAELNAWVNAPASSAIEGMGYVITEDRYYPSSDELTSRAIDGINSGDVNWDDVYELSRRNAEASAEAVASANAYVAAMQARTHSSGELSAAVNSLDAERVGRTLTDQLMMALAAHEPDAKRAALRHLKRAVNAFFDRKIDELAPDKEEQKSDLYDCLFSDKEIF